MFEFGPGSAASERAEEAVVATSACLEWTGTGEDVRHVTPEVHIVSASDAGGLRLCHRRLICSTLANEHPVKSACRFSSGWIVPSIASAESASQHRSRCGILPDGGIVAHPMYAICGAEVVEGCELSLHLLPRLHCDCNVKVVEVAWFGQAPNPGQSWLREQHFSSSRRASMIVVICCRVVW